MKRQKKKIRDKPKFKTSGACPKCGERASHFCPPCFGDPGFYICEPKNNKKLNTKQAKCICTPNGVQVKCPVHGFTGGFISPPEG